ncbi:MAG: MazG-like family protein [Patescibacteria group bacterium]
MLYKTLWRFIEKEQARFKAAYAPEGNEATFRLAQTTKLAEEVGELCNEMLALNGYQRQEKLAQHNQQTLADEVADVLIATLILAKSVGVNPNTALRHKIKKIGKHK